MTRLQELPRRGAYTTLVVIAAVALLLRCLLIGRESLWLDEAASWHFISGGFARALRAEPTNPPLYYTVLYFWTSWFGTSEAALRSLSVIPSTAAVLVTFFIGRRLLSTRAGLLAAGYQAISTFHIYYAQEARAFALLLFFLSASFLCLLKAIDEDGSKTGIRWRWFALYAVLAALALYTHFIATFFLACHGLYVVVVCRRSIRLIVAYALSGALACVAFAPWLFRALANTGQSGQSRRHVLLKLPQTYFSFLFGDRLIPLDERAVRDIAGTLRAYAPELIAACLLAAAAIYFSLRYFSRAPARTWLAVIAMGAGPVAMSFAVWSKVQLFDERYLIACSPFVYLAVAAGIAGASTSPRRGQRLAGTAVALGFVALLGMSLWNYYGSARFGREQWREAVQHMETNTPAGRTLVVLEPDYIHFCTDYYGRRSVRAAQQLLLTPEIRSTFSIDSVAGFDNIWLVRSHHRDDTVLDTIKSAIRERESVEFPKGHGISLHLFDGASGL